MPIKSIVACTTGQPRYDMALSSAAALAAQHGAHLSALCLGIDRTNPGVYYAGAGTVALQSNMEMAREDALAAEASAKALLAKTDVPWDAEPIIAQIGTLAPVIGERTQMSDLVVLPRPYGENCGVEDVVTVEAALFQTRVPVLIVPPGMDGWSDPKRVVIAWNQSPEALTAVRGAMDFLGSVDMLDIAIIDPPQHTSDRSDPGGMLAQMLSRHGIHADITVLARTMPRISEVLLRHCRDREAEMLVMGAYGHSRLRESILGGATRNMLESADVPVLMGH